MQKGDYLKSILLSDKTIFSTKDIALLWGEEITPKTKVRLNYYVKRNELYRIRRGFYARDKNYNKLELATRIYIPSYISFETVLVRKGSIFQYYDSIFIASYITREITVENQVYSYRKLKDNILTNTLGIEIINQMSIATLERAFLDILYVYNDYYFDNLRGLNWEKVFEILPIYGNKRMTKKVNSHYREFKRM